MDEENLGHYGTPLQPLDEDTVHTSKAPRLSDQIVTDKQGRRRFHGAFTGGFSAGFFNSVGSKEGWTPSTFVSSRSSRAEKVSKNDPTAYMDEEDLDSFGIAKERIQATSDYDDPRRATTKRKKTEDWRGPIPGKPVLEDLLRPVNVTVGMKLLMKLGWRPGQGVGPRVSRREKRRTQKERARLYSMNYPDDDRDVISSSESEEEEQGGGAKRNALYDLGFAPADVQGEVWKTPKADFFGLGYKPLEKGNVLGGKFLPESLNMMEKQKRISIRGQAFGVGAFEEEDENIYSKEDMSEYDFELGASSKETGRRRESRWDPDVRGLEEALEGFRLSRYPLPKPKSALLPRLPPNFKPWHEPYRRRFERRADEVISRLCSDERKRIVSNPPSVEIRCGVKKTESSDRPPSSLSPSPFLSTFVETSRVEDELPSSSDLKSKPFAAQPEKQKRYEAYLATNGRDLSGVFPPYMTEWEREREKDEFARASGTRKPFLSLAMSSRFTSASFDDGPMKGFNEGLNTMKDIGSAGKGAAGRSLLLQEETREDVKAAKTKMFGQLTQTTCQWHPDKILCKRFNVPHPYPYSSAVGIQSQPKEKPNIFSFLSSTPIISASADDGSEDRGSIDTRMTQTLSQETKQEEDYGLKVPVSDPPTLDLFKAIFEDSSSDSEAEDKNKTSEELPQKEVEKPERNQSPGPLLVGPSYSKPEDKGFKSASATSTTAPQQQELDQKVIASKAKGIFKGLDFAALNEYRVASSGKVNENGASADSREKSPSHSRFPTSKESERRSSDSSSESSDEGSVDSFPTLLDGEYGPVPPPALRGGGNTSDGQSQSDVSSFGQVSFSKSLLEVKDKKKKKKQKKRKAKEEERRKHAKSKKKKKRKEEEQSSKKSKKHKHKKVKR